MARRIDPVTGEIIEEDGTEQEFFGDIDTDESGGIQQGPTPEMPFKFTEQALNPRAEAVSGMAQRDPRARSAFTGVDPNAQRGQQAQMSEEDKKYEMGKMFGLSKGKVDEAMDPSFTMWKGRPDQISDYKRSDLIGPKAYKALGAGLRENVKSFEGETVDPFKTRNILDYQSKLKSQIAEMGGEPHGRRYTKTGQLREDFQKYGMLQGQLKKMGLGMTRGLNDEQQIFRTFMHMTPEAQAKVDFGDMRFISAMARRGHAGAGAMEGFAKMGPGKQRKYIQEVQPAKKGNIMSKIGKAVVLGGFSAMMGGILAGPLMGALGSTLGGGLAGAGSGIISSGMNQLIAGEFNPQGMAMSAGLGFAGGAAGGALFGGGGAGYQGPDAGGLTGTAGAPVSGAQGGLSGAFQSVKNFAAPVTDFLGSQGGAVVKSMVRSGLSAGAGGMGEVPEYKSQGGTGLSSNMFTAQSQGIGGQQSRFQRKPDDPFYQAPTDLESAQGELV